MKPISELIHRMIDLHQRGQELTLLAVCPNSVAVLEAAIVTASSNRMPMLFAATLNQVDRGGGYTGWTPSEFIDRMDGLAADHESTVPLYPCLDHGGPWLKDEHTSQGLSLEETMDEVKASLTACLEAGYTLLHIDPTVDRTLPRGQPLAVEIVVERTIELISYAERERERLGLPPVSYEVGTEEVHGGLADFRSFDRFLTSLRAGLFKEGLETAWPCFVVGKVGTDLHTSTFDPETAKRLYERVAPLGSVIKGHYTDWVANPAAYPKAHVGGANVGPEFTATELEALYELCNVEQELLQHRPSGIPSGFRKALKSAVIHSGRWRKWLSTEEVGRDFDELKPARQEWLVDTGARYVWTDPRVAEARERLYDNLRRDALSRFAEPHAFVVQRIAQAMQKYVDAFNLRGSLSLLT